MILPEHLQRLMLIYLSDLVEGPGFRESEDLCRLTSRELLQLAEKVDDAALGMFVNLCKSASNGKLLFDRLMGEHEMENMTLVDSFFNRYLQQVMQEKDTEPQNPLSLWMPPTVWDDLVFMQSRQAFFLRQKIETIVEYLRTSFSDAPTFSAGQQIEAWHWFWSKLLNR